jgi:hypothetical protein
MSTPKHTAPAQERWIWLAVIAVGLFGILPYLPVLEYWPWSSDSVKWFSKSNINNREWLEWAFGHRHFIGYRPIAALSLTLNSAIGGPFPLMYRLTDLLFFFGTGMGVYALWATMTRRVDGWGLLATSLFFCHPSAQDILPFLARRTYLLALFFSTLALICFCRHLNAKQDERRWMFSSCACLVLALFSNEFAYVTIGFMVLLCCTTAPKISLKTLRPALPVVGIGCISLGARWYVLGHFGGYHVAYLAKVRGGERVTTLGADFWEVFQASLHYTFFPSAVSGGAHWVYGGALGTGVVVAYYGWRSLVRPLRNWERPTERLKLWLLFWLLGYSLLYGLANTWFWRQGFPMVIPMALLVTIVARDTKRDFQHDRSLIILNFIPQFVLVMSMLFYSPQLRGEIDEEFAEVRNRRNRILNELIATTREFGPEVTVYLAIPLTKQDTGTIDFWARESHPGPAPRYVNLGSATEKTEKRVGPDSAILDEEHQQVHLNPRLTLHSNASTRLGISPGTALQLADEPTPDVLFFVQAGVGRTVYILAPSERSSREAASQDAPAAGQGKKKGKDKKKGKKSRQKKGKDKKKGKKSRQKKAEQEAAEPPAPAPTADDRVEAPTTPREPSTTEARSPHPVDVPAEP